MKFALIGSVDKYNLVDVAAQLVAVAHAHGAEIVADAELAGALNGVCPVEEHLETCDAAIALGGDGTVLKAVHRVGFAGVPVMGVNLGTLGFLAEVPIEEMDVAIAEIVSGDVVREERSFLVAETAGPRRSLRALNEIVIDRRGASHMIQVDMSVDGMYLNTYIADGIIISTPTGSTAYSMSAGGPIVSPASRDLVITPLAPHALTARPLVVPDSVIITITAKSNHGSVALSADGYDYDLASPADIEIRLASSSVTFLRRRGVSNYDVLRAKLLWGKDARGVASKQVFRDRE